MEAHHEHHDRGELHVRVLAPSALEPREFTFPGAELVGTAAAAAAADFGLPPTSPSFELEGKEQVLDRSLTLEAAGVHDGDELELVDVGGGV